MENNIFIKYKIMLAIDVEIIEKLFFILAYGYNKW